MRALTFIDFLELSKPNIQTVIHDTRIVYTVWVYSYIHYMKIKSESN